MFDPTTPARRSANQDATDADCLNAAQWAAERYGAAARAPALAATRALCATRAAQRTTAARFEVMCTANRAGERASRGAL